MQSLACELWVMERNALRRLALLAESTISVDLEQVRAARQSARQEKAVAVIPIHGAMEARYSLMGEMLGMTSYEKIGAQLGAYLGDESVSSIVLDFCTPGGMVYGCGALAQQIYEGRATKPIIGVVNPMAASGGQWLAAACTRVVATPGSDLGSIGVVYEHTEWSKGNERRGSTVTVIRSAASPHKWEANTEEPLSDEARQHIQTRVDSIYEDFSGDVARFRGVSVDHVNEHFGKGRLVDAKQAVKVGLADRIDTLGGVLGKLVSGRMRLGSAAAEDNWNMPTRKESLLERVSAIKALTEGEEV